MKISLAEGWAGAPSPSRPDAARTAPHRVPFPQGRVARHPLDAVVCAAPRAVPVTVLPMIGGPAAVLLLGPGSLALACHLALTKALEQKMLARAMAHVSLPSGVPPPPPGLEHLRPSPGGGDELRPPPSPRPPPPSPPGSFFFAATTGADATDEPCETLQQFEGQSHTLGTCKPCLYFSSGLCHKGRSCTFCHSEHDQRQLLEIRPSKRTRECLERRSRRAAMKMISAKDTSGMRFVQGVGPLAAFNCI